MNIQNKLNFSRRIRRTPFTASVEKYGVTGFSVVNHTLLPKSFQHSIEDDYLHLQKYAQIWDVGCQRQVEIKGRDALKLIELMTPRSISELNSKKCLYIPLTDENGGIINDPILIKISDEHFYLSVADSDVLLWARGLAIGLGLNVRIREPDVWPLAIQGPKAADVLAKVFGERIHSLKKFNFDYFPLDGSSQLIAKTGYSRIGGFEIYLSRPELGTFLWETILEAGKPENIRPGSPNIIDRVEAGLLSYGNEMTVENTPLECNMDKFLDIYKEEDYIGKKVLLRQIKYGIKRRIKGVIYKGPRLPTITRPLQVFDTDKKTIVGNLTSGAFSPFFKNNIGLGMINEGYWDNNKKILVNINDQEFREGLIKDLPLIQ
ncbi:MAG: dimethylsulfoniopropionate demethylase [Alphaproteobacteria bacterium]|nr:MAG: dimethylsulfoniopropionate demethylase [Alphaproteobacteria bacterium]